jgi:hypothetical protein
MPGNFLLDQLLILKSVPTELDARSRLQTETSTLEKGASRHGRKVFRACEKKRWSVLLFLPVRSQRH